MPFNNAQCRDEEHSQSTSSVLKRRAQALIVFAGHALQTFPTKLPGDHAAGKAIGEIVSLLVHLATSQNLSTPDNNIDAVVISARSAMSVSLGVMPAMEFVNVVLAMLETGDTKVCNLPACGKLIIEENERSK